MLKYNLNISSRFEHLRDNIAAILKNDVPPEAEPIYMDRNTVYRLAIGNTTIVIKSFQVPNFIDSYLQTIVGKSKSHLSYINAKKLLQLGFRTPTPVAYGEVLNGNRLLRSYAMTEFISGGDLRGWVKNDISSDDSRIKQRIAEAGQWFGETLLRDDALRESLNEHLEQAAHRVAPEFAAFLTRHISDTVKSWDARDMSRQIELNIGKDLQFIRINGTLVGGTIGLLLWLLSQIPSLLHLHIG